MGTFRLERTENLESFLGAAFPVEDDALPEPLAGRFLRGSESILELEELVGFRHELVCSIEHELHGTDGIGLADEVVGFRIHEDMGAIGGIGAAKTVSILCEISDGADFAEIRRVIPSRGDIARGQCNPVVEALEKAGFQFVIEIGEALIEFVRGFAGQDRMARVLSGEPEKGAHGSRSGFVQVGSAPGKELGGMAQEKTGNLHEITGGQGGSEGGEIENAQAKDRDLAVPPFEKFGNGGREKAGEGVLRDAIAQILLEKRFAGAWLGEGIGKRKRGGHEDGEQRGERLEENPERKECDR